MVALQSLTLPCLLLGGAIGSGQVVPPELHRGYPDPPGGQSIQDRLFTSQSAGHRATSGGVYAVTMTSHGGIRNYRKMSSISTRAWGKNGTVDTLCGY